MGEELAIVVAELRGLLATQQAELERLRARVDEMDTSSVDDDRGAAPEVPALADARVSRRRMLGRAGAAAAAGVAGAVAGGGLLANPAAAENGDDLELGTVNNFASASTALQISGYENSYGLAVSDFSSASHPAPGYISAYSRNRSSGNNIPAFRGDAVASYAFYGTSKNVPAVYGESTGSAGVQGTCTGGGPAGVIGASTSTDGVYGLATAGNGVLGKSTSGAGVRGQSSTGSGVYGTTTSSAGVLGQATTGAGVYGTATSGDAIRAVGGSGRGLFATSAGQPAVHGAATSGRGVYGQSDSGNGVEGTSSGRYGVFASSGYIGAYCSSTGSYGVYGRSTGGTAVGGQGAVYGGSFHGDKAAVYLAPQAAAGKPTSGSHSRGELLCDKNGALWFCTTAGTPGTWKKVSLV